MDHVFGGNISWVMQHNVSQSLGDQFGKHENKAFSLEEVFAEIHFLPDNSIHQYSFKNIYIACVLIQVFCGNKML